MDKTKVTKDLEAKTLTVERSFAAPADQVWAFYAEQSKFERWWGPEGWETTVKEFTFEPGGRVHYGMKCVDEAQGEWYGQVSWGVMEIQAVDAPHSFTYKDYFSDESGVLNTEMPALTVTNEFLEEADGCRFLSRSQADSAEQIEQLLEMGMIEGFDSQLGKLDSILAHDGANV